MKILSSLKMLSLRVADEIATKTINVATRNSFTPISVTVMDPLGNPIVSKRMDDCPPNAYPQMALAKANTCIAVRTSSRAYGEKYLAVNKNGQAIGPETFARVLNQIAVVDGQLTAFPGGILVRDKETGQIVGSVGVSGAAGDEDEYCAVLGVRECTDGDTLFTEPLDPTCKTTKE